MVNLNFREFRETQRKHRPAYLGTDQNQNSVNKDPEYNNQNETDELIGSKGYE